MMHQESQPAYARMCADRLRHPVLWVYGTLRPGGRNDILRLTPQPVPLGTAHTLGWLFDLGAYPGLVLPTSAPALSQAHPGPVLVRGELFRVPPELWPVLDAIEEVTGSPHDEYRCRSVTVQGNLGPQQAWVYEISPIRVRECPLIGHGDWFGPATGHSR